MHTYRTYRGYPHISPSLLLAMHTVLPTRRLFLATNTSHVPSVLAMLLARCLGAPSAFVMSLDWVFSGTHLFRSPGETRPVYFSVAVWAAFHLGSMLANVHGSAPVTKVHSLLSWGQRGSLKLLMKALAEPAEDSALGLNFPCITRCHSEMCLLNILLSA